MSTLRLLYSVLGLVVFFPNRDVSAYPNRPFYQVQVGPLPPLLTPVRAIEEDLAEETFIHLRPLGCDTPLSICELFFR